MRLAPAAAFDPTQVSINLVDADERDMAAELAAATADEALPLQNELHGSHPNPFNPQTTIAFSLARSELVRLAVYDVSGLLVRTLVHGRLNASRHEIIWRGRE